MKDRRLEQFGKVWGASGVQGFFGEGWWFHKYLRLIGLFFWRVTFVAKTTTLRSRAGNMPTEKDGMTPKEKFPKCVYITPKMWMSGIVLNAVGLTGPGTKVLLQKTEWQLRTEPFIISFMSVASTSKERLIELKEFVDLLFRCLAGFRTHIALQLNFSCPNTGHDTSELFDEVAAALEIASKLGIPLIPKFNLLVTPEQAIEISKNPNCAGICVTNTFPFGTILPEAWWIKHFGTADPKESPLAQFGGGGLSGKPILPYLCEWIKDFRTLGGDCHINAGGGILGPWGAIRIFIAGADSISLGTIAMLRPWMMLPTILVGKLA